MTETEKKALALVKAHGGQYGLALEAAIEQHEAFKLEVSAMLIDEYGEEFCRDHSRFVRFIIAKPDPLVEALKQLKMSYVDAEDFRAALAARGLEIREKQP